MNINTTPPNNLDQLVAWTRIFVSELNQHFQELEREVKEINNRIKRIEDEWF